MGKHQVWAQWTACALGLAPFNLIATPYTIYTLYLFFLLSLVISILIVAIKILLIQPNLCILNENSDNGDRAKIG